MPTPPIGPANRKAEYRFDIPVGVFSEFRALDPHHRALIEVFKDGETVKIDVTGASKLSVAANDSIKITDLEAADVPYVEINNDAVDFIQGDSRGLTGIKLTGTSTTNVIKVVITQF